MEEKMSEENIKEVEKLEAQIHRLQAEVAALQRHKQDNHKDMTLHIGGQMQDALWVSFMIITFSFAESLSQSLHIGMKS